MQPGDAGDGLSVIFQKLILLLLLHGGSEVTSSWVGMGSHRHLTHTSNSTDDRHLCVQFTRQQARFIAS
jgi:hypothetical protein